MKLLLQNRYLYIQKRNSLSYEIGDIDGQKESTVREIRSTEFAPRDIEQVLPTLRNDRYTILTMSKLLWCKTIVSEKKTN